MASSNIEDKRILMAYLLHALYNLPGCATGGLCHIITDDNNLKDSDIDFVLQYCDREENKDRLERGLCKLICEELKPYSIEERYFLINGTYQRY